MKYFILCQDKRITDAVKPIGISKLVERVGFTAMNWDALDDLPVQFKIVNQERQEYIDFLAHPLPLVSDRSKQLLEKFDPQIFFKPVYLADYRQMQQTVYWLIVPSNCDCLSSQCEFYKNMTTKKLVIDPGKVAGRWIFKVAGIMEHFIVVHLGVAESMLQNDFKGIQLKPVAMEG